MWDGRDDCSLYFWQLSKCSTWGPTYTTSAQGLLCLSVPTHWDSEIVPPTGDDLGLGSSLCWEGGYSRPTGAPSTGQQQVGCGHRAVWSLVLRRPWRHNNRICPFGHGRVTLSLREPKWAAQSLPRPNKQSGGLPSLQSREGGLSVEGHRWQWLGGPRDLLQPHTEAWG